MAAALEIARQVTSLYFYDAGLEDTAAALRAAQTVDHLKAIARAAKSAADSLGTDEAVHASAAAHAALVSVSDAPKQERLEAMRSCHQYVMLGGPHPKQEEREAMRITIIGCLI